MPTIVGILTFISMINTTIKQETSLLGDILVFTSWNFMLTWVEHEKSLTTSGLMWDLLCVQLASYHLHVNQKSEYDYDDV